MTLLMHLMLQHRANAQAFLLHSCSVKPNLSKRSTESGLDRDGLRALVGPSLGSQAKHCKHGSEVLYVRIGQPKTRHRAAASQHVRVDHLGVACWIVDACPQHLAGERFGMALGRPSSYALMRCSRKGTPFLPSSLRPGGATFLFRSWDENLTRLQMAWQVEIFSHAGNVCARVGSH